MLNPPFAPAYRALLSERVRAPLWHLRSAAQALFAPNPVAFRERMTAFYKSIGNYRPIIRTACGTRLSVDLRDQGVGWPIFMQRKYEPAETRFISQTLRPGDVFVDIGANIGYFTTLASRLVGRLGKVIAFEPDPDHCELLQRNLRLNGARNAVIRNEAIGAHSGASRLYRSPSNFGDHRVVAPAEQRQSIPISMRRFDEVCAELRLERADFIKIDVQGYEPHVIDGMGASLDRLGVTTMLMEFWPNGIRYASGSPQSLLDTLLANGFALHELTDSGEALPVEPIDLLFRAEAMNRENPLTFCNLVLRKGAAP